MEYICQSCAAKRGILNPAYPTTYTGTEYQLGKFLKHTTTAAGSRYPIQSVFDDPSYETYENYIVTTTASGFVEIDDQNRTNVIWVAGSGIGAIYTDGIFQMPGDSVKVVFHDDEFKIHPFLEQSIQYRGLFCEECGEPIPAGEIIPTIS